MSDQFPGPDDRAWESAMNRDFDARVRDLNEAPLSFDHVKGRAMTIRRNRRLAAACGALAGAAVITPLAVLASNGADTTPDVPPANQSTEVPDDRTPAPDPTAGDLEYVRDGTWYRSDGSEVDLPEDVYDSAVIWNDQLVATRWDGEVYSVADVVAPDGTVVESFETTGPVVVNEAGTTIAYVDTDGAVQTRWDGGEVSLGTVDLSAPGETIGYTAAAVVGGPDCHEAEDGCVVHLNSGTGTVASFDSHGVGDSAVEQYLKAYDATEDGAVTVVTEVTDDGSCGGLFDVVDGRFVWETCDYTTEQISPGGAHITGLPSYLDGIGNGEISILDAATGEETGRYAPEGGFVSTSAWLDADHLALTVYDGARWHVISLAADGTVAELVEPVPGEDVENPFVLVQR